MKNKRLLSALMLLSVLASVASCGETAETPAADGTSAPNAATAATEPVVTEEPEQVPNLPEMDWGGRTFNVLGRVDAVNSQFDNFEVYSEGEDGEVVNDAIFRRNTKIEDKYNVHIDQKLVATPQDMLKKTVSTGDNAFDLAFVEYCYIGPCGQNGYFYDLNTVQYIDFEQPWWNSYVNDIVSLNGKVFYTTSDFSLRDKNRAYILTYNPALAAQYDLPDIVEIARDGKWTLDLMTEYVKLVSADLNGNGESDLADQYGVVMDSYNAFAAFTMACNNQIVGVDKDNKLTITMNTEHMVDSIDKVLNMTADKSKAIFCDDWQGKDIGELTSFWSVSSSIFYAGRALFTCAFPHSLKKCSEKCDFDYTVIPYPKYDENQKKYYSMADVFAMLFGIPASSTTPEFSGFMLEALSAASTQTTLRAYYEVSCKTKYSYNEASAEMLDLSFSGIIYDRGIFFRDNFGLYPIIGKDIPNKKQNNFASLYEKAEKKALKALEKLSNALDALE